MAQRQGGQARQSAHQSIRKSHGRRKRRQRLCGDVRENRAVRPFATYAGGHYSALSLASSISASNSALALIGRAKYHQFSFAVHPSSSATSSPHKQTFVGSVRPRIFSSARLSRSSILARC